MNKEINVHDIRKLHRVDKKCYILDLCILL